MASRLGHRWLRILPAVLLPTALPAWTDLTKGWGRSGPGVDSGHQQGIPEAGLVPRFTFGMSASRISQVQQAYPENQDAIAGSS